MDYTYKVLKAKAVDGDTLDVVIDLGFKVRASKRVRLLGVDTPELRGGSDEDKAKGQEAKDHVNDWLGRMVGSARTLVLTSGNGGEVDSFGRILGDITALPEPEIPCSVEDNLAKSLLAAGLADEVE